MERKQLLLDIARKKLSQEYSKKIHHRRGEPNNIGVIDWLIQDGVKLSKTNYVDDFGNTILHLLVKDLPSLMKDSRLKLLFDISYLSELFQRYVNVKNNNEEIPLDIVLDELFSIEKSDKCTNDIDDYNNMSIFLKYINYLVLQRSNTQKLLENDNLLNIALMCKTDDESKILKNILENLDIEFKNNFVNEEKLGSALQKLDNEEQKGLIQFVKWLFMSYITNLEKETNNDSKKYKELIFSLYNKIKETTVLAKNFLINTLYDHLSNKSLVLDDDTVFNKFHASNEIFVLDNNNAFDKIYVYDDIYISDDDDTLVLDDNTDAKKIDNRYIPNESKPINSLINKILINNTHYR